MYANRYEKRDFRGNKMLTKLEELIGKGHVLYDEPMKKHTTFRVGGSARALVEPGSAEDVKSVVEFCKSEQIPYYIVGNGSNLLVSDKGYDGVIIHLFKNMSAMRIEGNKVYVQAGALLSKVAVQAGRKGLTGMEFASGIPGTIGGALVMNAGAYGGEMKDVVRLVQVMCEDGSFREYTGAEMEFGYRTSRVLHEKSVALEAVLELTPGDPTAIQNRMEELKEARTTKQPLNYASAGSTFKRPEGYFAGKLIRDAGLSGFSVGDAQVSEKHCGFVINRGEATAADVAELIRKVQEQVYEKFQVKLEPEVRMLGF